MKEYRKKTIKWKYIISIIIFVSIILLVSYKCNINIIKDQLLRNQWYLHNTGEIETIRESPYYKEYEKMEKGVDINAFSMWKIIGANQTGEVIVALIDTGVDLNHEDLKGVIWENEDEIKEDFKDNDDNGFVDDIHGYNFCSDDGTLYEKGKGQDRHGTMCAGIIAAKQNGIGIAGVTGNSLVKIMPLKVMQNEKGMTEGKISSVVEAIKYAEANHAKICNISLSIDRFDKTLYSVMAKSDMLFVVSAGNGLGRGSNIDEKPVYPAAFDLKNIITVANLNYDGDLHKSSNYGKESVDIAAPGTSILSTDIEDKYSFGTGTSFAAPIVSGVAAVIFSENNRLNAYEVKQILMDSASYRYELEDKIACSGYVNGYAAVKKVL